MKTTKRAFPLAIQISFEKLFDLYRKKLVTANDLLKDRAQKILDIAQQYPELSTGIPSGTDLSQYKDQIDFVLEDLFASVLETNEIKIATVPFQENIFKASVRYENIQNVAGEDFSLQLMDFSDEQFYVMGCSIILNSYYGYNVDFRRPFYYSIPDALGIVRSYRVLYNADFVEVVKGENAKDITKEDLAELLDNFDNIDIWKEKFPQESWIFKGFVIANMYDATTDVALSNFKTNLLTKEANEDGFAEQFLFTMQGLFNIPEIQVGYAMFDGQEQEFINPKQMYNVSSFLLNDKLNESCHVSLCDRSYAILFQKKERYTISDVPKFHRLYPKNRLYKTLYKQGIGSAIITPLVSRGKIMGVMELVSPNPQDLNSINATKLEDIMPYLVDAVRRGIDRKEAEIELMIQNECTSIHPSVHWKFRKEAERVLLSRHTDMPSSYQEITFDNVYPLYGQVDIKGSSTARNDATTKDLIEQLLLVGRIVDQIYEMEELPIYEQIRFRIDSYMQELEHHLDVDTERNVLAFLRKEILPLYKHLSKKSPKLKELIDLYNQEVDHDKGFVYKFRKEYDQSVMKVNKSMAELLDQKQNEAQRMYPHYYERFKTDGVEHNLYIGESITKEKSFNKIYLYNLRLWQLQAMCEMENDFYHLKQDLPVPMDVASMILVFNTSLALRFRMDEKRFDVDGTYNARYEVVKKRVDKAYVKGTNERITQPGKITIVYSQKADEKEYLKYVGFLQSKHQLGNEVEILELEDLQGVTGLKAIRVNVLYNRPGEEENYYTYEDLMKEIGA
ncbi:GAF domain-containing protein [Aureitalea marina]|uniref:GAF domain-containing protein n=1 Tax=Aureitalea marina TaxID=930804 RepID=A0A2S7KNP0_9FLAO|nr:GAF domain-containing protein [Aureitalea marina]PQB04220.1 GAF domain-containing protein [Aureitalea marina]